jgi:mono/diheme cytochrome c family protein
MERVKMGKLTLAILGGGILMLVIVLALLWSSFAPQPVQPARNVSLADDDLTATACAVSTLPVMMWEIFGTPTPTITPEGFEATAVPFEGDVARGEELFFGRAQCTACHHVEDELLVVGPSLMGIASRAGSRRPDMDAVTYLRAVIRDPANVTPSTIPGIMPRTYSELFTTWQIDDIVAYLLTLE